MLHDLEDKKKETSNKKKFSPISWYDAQWIQRESSPLRGPPLFAPLPLEFSPSH